MKIVLIGSGNVATVLGRKMVAAQHEVLQVFSPNPVHAQALAGELGCSYADRWTGLTSQGELYLVAISDQGLQALSGHLHLGERLAVHTAGAIPKDILRGVSSQYGVLYPLQSLRKEIRPPAEIPILIDANSPENLRVIVALATTISSQVLEVDDLTRFKLHLASVFVNNFTNHLYVLAESYCQRERIDFAMLLPLIEETVRRLHGTSPSMLQTGPAIRGDQATLDRHQQLLKDYPQLLDIYQILTSSIQGLDRP